MRELGKGQSVMFCGPMEVERKILHCSGKSQSDTIEVADVLRWSISETYIHTKKCIPLWATQGVRHQLRHMAWAELSVDRAKDTALEIAKPLLEIEAQSLEERYSLGERRSEEHLLLHNGRDRSLAQRKTQLEAIWAKCREFETVSFNNVKLREEQERELSPENEQERQVERPVATSPYNHSVHRDVKRFVQQGILERNSHGFQPAFELFSSTSAMECFEMQAWPGDLLVTADFARTVHASGKHHLDSFLRPVHWIVSRKNRNTVDCVVLSPFEAHALLPAIRQHKVVTLHVYSPRVSMSARTLEDLSFCAIPVVPKNWLNPPFAMLLNLFAGQLYLRSHEEYLSVCRFLGLASRPPNEQFQVACDGFVSPASRPEFDAVMERDCPFKTSPVEFLRILMALRRKGQSFQKSHLGRILHGELLSKEDFQG